MIVFPDPPEGGVPQNNWLRVKSDREWLQAESENPAVRSFVRMLKNKIGKTITSSVTYWCSNGGVSFYHRILIEFVEKYGEELYGSPVVHMSSNEDEIDGVKYWAHYQPLLTTIEVEAGKGFNKDLLLSEFAEELRWRYDSFNDGRKVIPFLPVWTNGPSIDPHTFEPCIRFHTWHALHRKENT